MDAAHGPQKRKVGEIKLVGEGCSGVEAYRKTIKWGFLEKNKKRSLTAILSVNGVQKRFIKSTNFYHKKTHYWQMAVTLSEEIKPVILENFENQHSQNINRTFSHAQPIKIPIQGTQ